MNKEFQKTLRIVMYYPFFIQNKNYILLCHAINKPKFPVTILINMQAIEEIMM